MVGPHGRDGRRVMTIAIEPVRGTATIQGISNRVEEKGMHTEWKLKRRSALPLYVQVKLKLA